MSEPKDSVCEICGKMALKYYRGQTLCLDHHKEQVEINNDY